MYALVDCNDFYASCERVFQPRLRERPVIVLSNNDGCVIALSEEAGQLGLEMGQPFFKVRDIVRKNDVAVRSSNYTLYGDMSERISECLETFTPRLEYYSIDEMFLDLSDVRVDDFVEYGDEIRETVRRWTGVPVSVGMAPTKTLTKVAMELAKVPENSSVQVTTDWPSLDAVLDKTDVGDVWGVGPAYAGTCREAGIETALDLKSAPAGWVRSELTVTGLARKHELGGNSCIPFEAEPDPRDSVCSSRMFGRKVTDFGDLREAVVTYVERAARRVRNQEECASRVGVFIRTSPFDEEPDYGRRAVRGLSQPTDSSRKFASTAVECLKKVYRDGLRYHKAGVILGDLVPRESVQRSFEHPEDTSRTEQVSETVDQINEEFGKDTVQLLGGGLERDWSMNRDNLSARFTTEWSELPEVKAGFSC